MGRSAQEFERRFGRPPHWAARAPGRVNLIGEHTDYNEGLVLPCAIDRDTLALAAPRGDDVVRVFSVQRGEEARFSAGAPRREGRWVDYVQGVFWAFGEWAAREQGEAERLRSEARKPDKPGGLDLFLTSEVPEGSGLSSSAALELALVMTLSAAQGASLDALARVRVAHRAENGFVGVASGLMDQMASALGQRHHALRIDCRSLAWSRVALPREARLLIADSGVRRRLADGAYNQRRAECEEALAQARTHRIAAPDARALRDLSARDLSALERALDATLFRRARHVITENERVDAVCAAFERGDLAAAGSALREGMRSLQRDFEVSRPELDALCEIADAQPGVYGSRLTGAGFGGCTVHLVAEGEARAVSEALAGGFASRFGRRAPVLEAVPSDGACLLPLEKVER